MDNKVVIVAIIYNSYPQIISSLICQTHKNWELILIHDGENSTGLQDIVNDTEDGRIKYIQTFERKGNFGHPWRQWALEEIKNNRIGADADYIIITNSDNYYVPSALEYFINGFRDPSAIAVYCDSMVHNYQRWGIIPCSVQRGYIDCGGVMFKKDVACHVGWNNTTDHSADWFFFEDIIKKHGVDGWKRVAGTLFIHN